MASSNYQPLDEYSKAWIFRHKDLPVSEADLALIKPMTQTRAETLWSTFISKEAPHYSYFTNSDWPEKRGVWQAAEAWQGDWESEEQAMPEALSVFLSSWDERLTVYMCYENDHIIETQWAVFKRNWKNFLFIDDGPILMGRRQQKVVQFFDNGQYKMGIKPE
ncbi:MAG: DUF2947 domain-containing protein [Pontibacterium sp.]